MALHIWIIFLHICCYCCCCCCCTIGFRCLNFNCKSCQNRSSVVHCITITTTIFFMLVLVLLIGVIITVFCRPQLLLSTSTFHSFLAIDATQPISPFVTNSTHTDQFMLRHQCKWCTMCIAHGVLLKWSYKCIQSVRCTLHSQVSSTDYWSNYLLKKLATVLVLPQAHEPIKFCSGAECSGSHFPNSFQTYFTILDNLVRNE